MRNSEKGGETLHRIMPAHHWTLPPPSSVYQSFDCGLSLDGRKAPPP